MPLDIPMLLPHHLTVHLRTSRTAVWAPTATEVQLLYYGPAARGGTAQTYPMSRGPRGTWTLPRPASWLSYYYTYRVTAYNPWTNRFEVRLPYTPVRHAYTCSTQWQCVKPCFWLRDC